MIQVKWVGGPDPVGLASSGEEEDIPGSVCPEERLREQAVISKLRRGPSSVTSRPWFFAVPLPPVWPRVLCVSSCAADQSARGSLQFHELHAGPVTQSDPRFVGRVHWEICGNVRTQTLFYPCGPRENQTANFGPPSPVSHNIYSCLVP